MLKRVIQRLFAGIALVLVGFAAGVVVAPVAERRAPVETAIAGVASPLATVQSALTASVPPPGTLTLPTVKAEHATFSAQATESQATVGALRGTVGARETEVARGLVPTRTPPSTQAPTWTPLPIPTRPASTPTPAPKPPTATPARSSTPTRLASTPTRPTRPASTPTRRATATP